MIQFRPVTPTDLPMLMHWLETPEVARWYTDEGGIEAALDDPRVTPRIVLENDGPVAYLQDYDIHAWDGHPLAHLPPGARGIDTFIGAAADMNRGLGSAYLAAFAETLFDAGVPAAGIDPDPDNHAAIRAYEKAGFRRRGQIETKWGRALVMDRFAPLTPD